MYQIDPDVLLSIVAENDEQQVRQTALETNYLNTDLITSASVIAKVLLMRWLRWDKPEIDFPNQTNTRFEQWIEKCHQSDKLSKAYILVTWLTAMRGNYANYPVFLYNKGLWRTEEVFRLFLEDKNPPPYLAALFFNLFRQALGISHTELHHMSNGKFDAFAPLYKQLLTTDLIWDWAAKKKQSFHFYGGQTNTLLGGYDKILKNPRAGLDYFNRGASARYDIGGGFNTSEIERIIGCRFTSADVRNPSLRDHDDDLIIRKMKPNSVSLCIADDEDRNEFLKRQDRIEWLPFDVFNDSFPDASSYAFTSTGFMTSTVRPTAAEARGTINKQRLGTLSTSFHALLRVMEKVALGKPVDLFTLQRASGRVYKYKTVLLQWRDGKLIRLITTDDNAQGLRWTKTSLDKIYEAINPSNIYYSYLLNNSLAANND